MSELTMVGFVLGSIIISGAIITSLSKEKITKVISILAMLLVITISLQLSGIAVEGGSTINAAHEADVSKLIFTFYSIVLRFLIFAITISLFYVMYIAFTAIKTKKRNKRWETEEEREY